MVNAQEYINKNFSNKRTEKIDIRNIVLEGGINLSEYTELKDIHFVGCRLNNFTFLKTVSNKKRLTILDLGHNSTFNFQDLLWTVSQFSNLEWVSLDGIQAPNHQVKLKPWGYLPKCHTFAVTNNLVMGWEYSLDILQRAYWDDWRNNQFLKWKKDFLIARILAKNEIRLERENEQLKLQNNHQQTQLAGKDKQIEKHKSEAQNLQTQLERERNKNKFLEEQLEQQTQIVQPNPPAFKK